MGKTFYSIEECIPALGEGVWYCVQVVVDTKGQRDAFAKACDAAKGMRLTRPAANYRVVRHEVVAEYLIPQGPARREVT